ncbi:hypothetical protein HG536_0A09590 [Torulaspora globosa]|uniref:HD domain-containing protein n=1 Tax=Torulaspora globosa TaxID=48254 RepID=A0A7G3ZCA6_9SACH|nr:uncharacterized protein HG536_0A09590 [Torulaspora globosa]QLL31142.1 hypothetical protein HG536_0A09590 [Torulaspora globosa]
MSQYGFVKVDREVEKVLREPKAPTAQSVVPVPSGKLAQFFLDYATKELPIGTLNHSLRIFQYGVAIIKDQFPAWDLDEEVIFVTALLHDIGTSDKNLEGTKLSFEYYGAFLSRELILRETGGDADYADAVAEAIIRHQELTTTGYITSLGLILQIVTTLDNVGANTNLIHQDTLYAVNEKYQRFGWATCFSTVLTKEADLKPWCHSTTLDIEVFREKVLNNQVTYEKK